MLCLKPAHIIIMKKAPTLNDDEPVRSWTVGTGGQGVQRLSHILAGQITLFRPGNRLCPPHYSEFSDLPSALNLEGSVPQIKLGEAASIAFEKHPLKRASVFP